MNALYRHLLEKYDVFFFDIFDTLLTRNVAAPTDIFDLAGANVLGSGKGEEFKARRIEAERKARALAPNAECTLDGIYACLDGYDEDLKETLKQAEITFEIDSVLPKKSQQQLYYGALAMEKKIVLISDMYLPSEVIGKMLEKCEYFDWDELYISNEVGVSKHGGKMFAVAMDELNIDPSHAVHLGDSVKADMLGARAAGLHFVPIHRKNRLGRLLG